MCSLRSRKPPASSGSLAIEPRKEFAVTGSRGMAAINASEDDLHSLFPYFRERLGELQREIETLRRDLASKERVSELLRTYPDVHERHHALAARFDRLDDMVRVEDGDCGQLVCEWVNVGKRLAEADAELAAINAHMDVWGDVALRRLNADISAQSSTFRTIMNVSGVLFLAAVMPFIAAGSIIAPISFLIAASLYFYWGRTRKVGAESMTAGQLREQAIKALERKHKVHEAAARFAY